MRGCFDALSIANSIVKIKHFCKFSYNFSLFEIFTKHDDAVTI